MPARHLCIFIAANSARSPNSSASICSRFGGAVIPVIYNLNLRDPTGYFIATKFNMHNKDLIFASNSTSVESSKLLTYLRLITATVNDPNSRVNFLSGLR